ncbi:keratin, type I cytoskeletal 12-like [Pelodytes ibericus]
MSFKDINRRASDGYSGSIRVSTYNDGHMDNSSEEMSTRRSSAADEYMIGSRQNSSGVGEASSGYYGEDSTSFVGGRSAQNCRESPNSNHGERSGGHRGSLQGNSEAISGSDYSRQSSADIRHRNIGGSGVSGYGFRGENSVGRQRDHFGGSSEGVSGGSYTSESATGGKRGNLGGITNYVSGSGYSSGSTTRVQRGGSSTLSFAGDSSLSGHRGAFGGSNSGLGGFSGRSQSFGEQRGDIGGGYTSVSLGGFSGAYGGGEMFLQGGEKETMQNLNTRLATYLEKVGALEEANAKLEGRIRNWYDTNKPEQTDNSKYYTMIEELKNKILVATMDNNKILLRVDNARLAADDFKNKYQTEVYLHQNVEFDINGLRKMLDDLTLDRSSLEAQIETLRAELTYLKKTHEEEIKCMQKTTGDVTVEVDAAPGCNILNILNDMRAQYEELAEKNRKKAEDDFNQKISELNSEISCRSAEAETNKNEVTELRRTMQTMEIDLQTQNAMKKSLENTLAETKGRYCAQLGQIQDLIRNLEEQLSQVRCDMESQSVEYKLLLDIKTRLENEIETYRRLMDGESSKFSEWSSRREVIPEPTPVPDSKKSRLVTTIIEDRVNGKIVSTKVDKIEQNM